MPSGVTYRAAITQILEGAAGDGIRRWWRDLDDLCDDLRTEVVEQVMEMRDFFSRRDALEAAGLLE